MTSPECSSGTERCREAFDKIGRGEKIILNLQGDEPFIQKEQIDLLISAFDKPETDIATLAEVFSSDVSFERLNNPNNLNEIAAGADSRRAKITKNLAVKDKPHSYYAFEILYWCGLRMGEPQ